MEHRQLNRIIGAVIFLIALVVYGMTVAKTTSYWDCGEFITCSYILGVPHPPGSPLYILIGRIFTMLPFFSDIGLRVNIISVLVSAFTIMFTYLIIVRLMREWRGIPQAMEEKLIIYTGGIVGALGLAFSDSFWFNAVEAEVYAVSMFFTAFVVWLILVWLEKAEEPVNDKYLMLIAYLIGLATGVHLLNILAIPTLFLIIYFKRAELKLSTFLLWSLGAVAVFGAIYPVIVKGIPWLLQEFSFWSVLTVAALLIGPFLIMPFAFQTSEKPYLIILLYVVLFNAVTLGSGNYTNPEVIKMNLFLIGFLVVARLARNVISNLAKNMMSGFKRTPLLHTVLLATTLILIGYSTYSMIYIRSGLKPAINENHPDVPSRFASYLNREQYGDIPLTERRAPVWEYQIKKMYVRYFGWQFIGKGSTLGSDNYIVETISTKGLMALPFLIGMIGMFQHFNRDWKRALSILTLFIMTGVAITLYLNQEDPQPRERDYAYVGSFFAFSIWIGIGASALLELVLGSIRQSQLLRKIGVTLTLVILFIAVPFNLFDFNYKSHNRTGNFVAWDYSYNILQSCEPGAIIFTNGDNDTFPLWYLQYVEGIRPDVRVVNLSLLNTDWYIKQLRDEEPRVPINFTDAQIENLGPSLWPQAKKVEIKVPRLKVLEYLKNDEDNADLSEEDIPENPAIKFELTHTREISGHKVLLVQDRLVLHIIAANNFEKPLYFAVTVSPENMLGLDNRRNVKGLANYLRMDGLAFKIMPYGGPRDFIAPAKLEKNIFEEFRYRNLNNPDVFFNNNIVGLLQNYRSAFLRLTSYYQSKSKTDKTFNEKTLAVLDKMNEVMPEEVIPLRTFRLSLNFGQIYAAAGRPEELEKRLKKAPEIYYLAPMDKLYMAEYYSQYLNNDAKAESLAQTILDAHPEFPETYGWFVSHYTRTNQFDKGVEILEKWLVQHPTDKQAQSQLASLKIIANQMDSTLSTKKEKSNGASEKP